MALLFTTDLDSGTAGTLPANWTILSGDWQLRTLGAISGTLAMGAASNSDGMLLINGNATMSDGTYTYQIKRQPEAAISPVFRSDDGFNNAYVLSISRRDVRLLRRAGGNWTFLDNVANAIPVIADETPCNVEVVMTGSTFEFRMWPVGGSRPSTAQGTWTDATHTTGKTGFRTSQQGSAAFNGADNITMDGTGTSLAPPQTEIARNAAGVYYSPDTWGDNGTYASANSGGSYLKFSFTGTSLSINTLFAASAPGPVIRAYIDDRPAVDVQIANGSTSTVVAASLSDATHQAVLVVAKLNEFIGWWDLTNAVRLKSFLVDNGKTIGAPASLRSKKMLAFADSIGQGVRVYGQGGYPGEMDSTVTVLPLIARALDAELGQLGYGGQGFETGGSGNVPSFNSSYGLKSQGVSRLTGGQFSSAPDYVLCMHGTNGTVTQANVATAIANLRAAAPSAWILMLVPPGGRRRVEITAATNAAITAGDRKVALIDAGAAYDAGLLTFGTPTAQAVDGLHPYAATNAQFAARYAMLIQDAIRPRRFAITVS